jgi:hypothetical protein
VALAGSLARLEAPGGVCASRATIDDLLPEFPECAADRWASWRVVLRVLDGLPLDAAEVEVLRARTGRTPPPDTPVKDADVVAGRRGGTSARAALVALDRATRARTWTLAPGEVATIPIIAADRVQAGVILGHVQGRLHESPRVRRMITGTPGRESIALTNGARIAMPTAAFRTPRGSTLAAAGGDDVAVSRTEDPSAHPAAEIPAALPPGLLTSGGPWILCSTPSARRGVVWNASTQHGATAGDPMVVWKASRLDRNPLRPAGDSAAADAQDAHAAAAE